VAGVEAGRMEAGNVGGAEGLEVEVEVETEVEGEVETEGAETAESEVGGVGG